MSRWLRWPRTLGPRESPSTAEAAKRLRVLRWLAAVACLLTVVMAGCAAPGDGADGTTFEGDGFQVRVPAGWQALATDPHDWRGGQTIALISTQALDPQCDGPGVTNCRMPVASLDGGSQLVWWVTTTCAGAACELPDGEPLLIGGREARRIEGHRLVRRPVRHL